MCPISLIHLREESQKQLLCSCPTNERSDVISWCSWRSESLLELSKLQLQRLWAESEGTQFTQAVHVAQTKRRPDQLDVCGVCGGPNAITRAAGQTLGLLALMG